MNKLRLRNQLPVAGWTYTYFKQRKVADLRERIHCEVLSSVDSSLDHRVEIATRAVAGRYALRHTVYEALPAILRRAVND